MQQARVLAQQLAGNMVTLMVMPSERRGIDSAVELQRAPLLQLDAAVWGRWQPHARRAQGLRDAVSRLRGNGNPCASICGPFS
eukprot:3335351-Pyramimonas_sp.AAC.1